MKRIEKFTKLAISLFIIFILFLYLGGAQSTSSLDFNSFSNDIRSYFDDKYLVGGTDYSVTHDLKDVKWLEDNVPDVRLIQAYASFVLPEVTETFIFFNGRIYLMPDDFNQFARDAHLQIIDEEDALGIADVYVKAWEPSGSEGIPAAVILQSASDIPQMVDPVPQDVAQQIKSPVIRRQDDGFVVDLYSWCEIDGWVREWHIVVSSKDLVTAENKIIGEYAGDCIIEGAVRDRISPSYREYLLTQEAHPLAEHTKDVYIGGVKRFVIHWRDEDFTAASDGDAATVVNWVVNAARTSWTTEINNWTFNSPPDAVIDIYMWDNTQPWGPVEANPNTGSFYYNDAGEQFIYINNDLSKWSGSSNIYYPPPKEDIYTIIFSHEFFHAIQEGYKVMDTSAWIIEGTARFVQTVILPNAEFWQNCNLEGLSGGPYRQAERHASGYINGSSEYLSKPNVSLLDHNPVIDGPYRACIYWRYMYKHHGGMNKTREVFERINDTAPGGNFGFQIAAINYAFGVSNLDFYKFARANYMEFSDHAFARKDDYYKNSSCYYPNVPCNMITYDAKNGPKSDDYSLVWYATDYICIKFENTKDVNITFEGESKALGLAPSLFLLNRTYKKTEIYKKIQSGSKKSESKILSGANQVDKFDNITMVVPRSGVRSGVDEAKYTITLAGCPIVTKNTPTDDCVPLDTNIEVEFNYKMNKSATEKAFSISPSVPGTFTWSNGDKTLKFDPSSDLEEETKYTVTIAETARSANDVGGMGLDGDKDGGAKPEYKFEFTTGKFGVEIDASPKSITVNKGDTATYEVTVKNTGECKDNFTLTYSSGWTATLNPTKFTLVDPGKTVKATLKVTAPANGRECGEDSTTTTVTATSDGNSKKKDSVSVKTIVDLGKCPPDTKCYAYKCENNKCKKIKTSGCDHPDESADVSTCSRCSQYLSFTSSNPSGPKIAVLSNGFPTYFLNLLTNFDESADLVSLDASSEELSNYSVFVVPTGGFYGISSTPSFKDKLEQYANNGGTLIVLTQQHGYDYEPVPGDLSGYGWLEDQSCHHRSTGISTYHVILSGQDSVILDANVDGYFTKYPDNATVLLSRTKNGMPAMLMYEYGKGRVIASTLYTDWANSYRQATKDGKNLIRDMIAWAKDPKDIPDYAPGDAIDIPINITNNANVTADNVSFRVRDPDKNVVGYVNVTNVSILPNETKIINFTYTAPSKLGIWRIDYSLLNNSNVTQTVYEVQRFAVSKYAANPGGFVYQGKKITYGVSSDSDEYAYGSNATFTIHIWNNGDIDKNITVYWEWIHEGRNLLGTFLVPAHDSISIPYTYNVYPRWSIWRFWSYFYDDGKYLGKSSVGGSVFSPSVNVNIETDKQEYAKGEDVSLLLNLTNNQKVSHNATVTVRTLDPLNKKIYEESFDANLSAYASANKTLDFSLPHDSKTGMYIVTAEAYENGDKIGSNSTYFEIPRFYLLRVSFDKPDKVYGIRQNLSLLLKIANTGSSIWSSWINTSIPSLSFFDFKYVSLNPNENNEIEYKNLGIPSNLTQGKHDVFVDLSYDNSTITDNFFIPHSDLRIEVGKKYKAGENLSFNISNVGGVDTTFNCSFKFVDWKGKLIYEDVVEDAVLSLKNKTISFEIHNQSVNGLYYLVTSCKDFKTEKETESAAICEVSGLKAALISDTKRRVYFKNENVSILTNITNQNGEIVNGTLNLKIVRVSIPNSTGQALARATAKLSGYKYKLEEHNIDRHNSSHNPSHNRSPPQSPSPPPTNFLPGLSPYNLIATARAASPPANLTPEPEPLPEDEFNESYGNESVIEEPSPPANLTPTSEHKPGNETGELPIEEPSPTPSINVTPTPEHEPLAPPADEFNESYDNESLPEEPVHSLTINVTPTLEPQSETEELPTLAVKSSSMEIGNETVWKDEVKIVNEDLIVNSTGNLTLINTTVIMNCSSDGQYHIEVQNGGMMHIFDSEITASDSRFEYYFQVKSGAKFEMRDSELHECGYTWGTNGDHAGLWINTNDTIIENNQITNSYCGIVLYQSNNNTLVNNTANSNDEYDIYLSSSNNNTLTRNTANSNREYGIYLSSSNNNTLTRNIANSHSYHGIYLSSSSNNTLMSNTANSNERYGIYLEYSNSNTLTSNFANSNEHYWGDYGNGICLESSSNNTLTNNTANSNRKYGIVLSSSNNNSLTNNTANLNHDHGIYLYSSNNNSLTINTASSNKYYHGIYLSSSNNNTLTSNTANSNDDHGIYLSSSSNNVLTNNTAKENEVYDLFIHASSDSHCNNRIDNTTGSGDRPIKYFKSSVNLSDEHFSELILCNADHSDINNVTVKGSSAKKNNGVLLVRTDFSNLTNINSSGNHHGVYLGSSHNNTLTSNIMTENSQSGVYLYDSCNNNTLKNNSVRSNSQSGIYLNDHSNNNSIKNNSVHSNSYYGGIYLNDHSNNNIIENNTISSNSGSGISLRGSCNNNAIGNNTIESNGNGISFGDASNINAIENNVIKNNKYDGIDLHKSHNNRIISNNLTSNRGHGGIDLYGSGGNTIEGNNVEKSKEIGIRLRGSWSNKIISNWITSNNGRGIHIEGSDNNNVTGNNVSFNSNHGIEFSGNNHVLADNIVNSNGWRGIILYGASNSILRNNTINSNSGWGIYMHAASYNTLFNNSINDNNRNFGVGTSHNDLDKHFNHSIDTSNTVNGKPIYYIVNEKDKIYDETTNAGYFAAVFCENITIKNLNNLTNNSEAVLFWKTHNSLIENISGTFNTYGINLMHSDNNTVYDSNLSNNSHGLYMWYSSGDEIRNCNISSNDKHGVYIYPSSNNNRMDSCIISSNEEHGVYINDHSNNNRIDNCVISSNKERGVFINDHSNSNDILNSSITSNGGNGFTIDGWTYNCELNNNSISLNNDFGIYICAGGSNKIFNNTIKAQKEGIYFWDGTNNILRSNNVTSDSYPLYFRDVGIVAQDIDTTNMLNGFKAIALSGVNNVTVTNFSVVMPDKIKVTNRGIINLANCKNISIENVTIVNHSAYGIFVYKSSGSVIANCTINSNNQGVYPYESSDNVIVNCTLNSNDRGIYLYKSEPRDILNNVLNNNRIGVGYISEDLYHCNIKGNEMNSNSEHGIYIGGCCGSSGETSISDNIMSYNGKRGIYISRTGGNVLINNNTLNSNEDGIYVSQAVYEATNFHVSNNTITNNDNYGIYFDGAKNNYFSITNNIINSNYYGLYVGKDSDSNLIYDNFFENIINAYAYKQNTWNITKTFAENGNIIGGPWLGGNYWSDYEGEDEDGDELGDTLLPYNCSGRINEGGDYLPLVMLLPPKEVLWEENITINLAEGETKNIISEVPASVFKDVTGKQKLSTTFYSNTTQIINISDPFFYITPKNTSLTMETDKRVYKPNETVLIYGEVKNHASAPADCNLSINKDGAEIFNDSFTLATDETRYYATNTSADASFTLEGTVDGVVVLDSLSVDSPGINASIIAPDVVGIKDFDVGVLIENIGNISADLNVSLDGDGKRWNITVPEGESQLLETTMNTSRNMTIAVIISGDVNETIQKEIICGENAKINITPEPTYLEGEAEIPFTMNNTGVLDSEFNATFSISSTGNQTITKHFFVPKEENITDSVSFNLTKGAHLLRYTSPFETVNTTINVLSPPEFILTSIHPAELNFTIGENVTLVFTVKNVGGSEGEAALKLSMIDFEDTNRTWIRAGAEENISFYFSIPDDLEEKSYKGIYVLAGTRSEFSFFVQGANISVDASLDKSMYAEGDTAVLTLELTNECKLDLDLYSRVKFNEYDSVQNFTLAGSGTETLVFYLPANFSGDNKVLYTVYMDSGRALYINSVYIYEELPDVPLRLFTEKDVYNMGEEVTIHIVDVTGTDMLNLTAPNFSYNDTISGPTTLEFTLPELRSGTYYIEYSFGNFSSTHPFDVRGYSARILEARLDKEEYISGNEMKLELNIEANRDVSGLLKTWIYDPEDDLIDEFAMNKTLEEGESEIEVCRTLSTDKSGIHAIVYGFSAELSGDSSTTLVSGAEYFDAESGGLCGDVAPYPDCNGIVDMGDVILLLNNVSYPEDPRYVLCNYWAGDCRCTGVRDMGDVILLLNYVSYPEDPGYVLDCC